MRKLGKFIYIFLLCLYFVVFFFVQRASILGMFNPFAVGLLFALVWAEQKVWLVAPAYILASMAVNFSFEYMICALIAVGFIAIPYYIHLMCKKRIYRWELGIYCLLAQTGNVVFWALAGINPFIIISSVLANVLFMYICMKIFEPILVRGFAFKLTSIELVCGAIILAALSDGLAGFDFFGYSFLRTFASLVLLSLSHTCHASTTCLVGGIIGLGTFLQDGDPSLIAPLIIWALVASAFKNKYRFVPALALIGVDAIMGFVVNIYYFYSILDIISLAVGVLIFIILPKSVYKNISSLLSYNSDRLASKNLLNRSREVLHRHICYLSEVFCDMNEVFLRLIKKSMSEEEVKTILYEEIRDNVCKNCPERGHCHRTFASDTKLVFEELITIALQRGKITLLDLPSYLSSRCNKAPALIGQVNSLCAQYKNYSILVQNVDMSKLLISDQLKGMAGLLKNLAAQTQANISFDSARENKIIDGLALNNILCTDAVVYEKDSRTVLASLIVKSEDSSRGKIPEVVSKICGSKMSVMESYPSSRMGLVTLNLASAPMFDCIFGLASATKAGSNISGDCHSVVRLDNDRFLFALCDGMGSGEEASKKSETTISLLENFYKAGFDNEIILSSVNRLLNLERDDVFSTIDVCVVDLKNGIADFVKSGSPTSFIRREESCECIESGALPVGVLQEMKASTKKAVLCEKDMIVLYSDGVSDAFATDQALQDFVMGIKSANPQEFADKIVERALAGNNGYAVDDMTCLVIKIQKQ